MSNFVDNFDWTNGNEAGGDDYTQEAAPADALDFVMPSFESAVDADRAEQEAADNKYASPPPGKYLFVVDGFLKAPERIEKTGYVNGQPATYHPWKVALKLKVVGQGNLSMLDNIELPPSSRDELRIFQNVSTKPDGKTTGFMNRKLEHLIKRLGFPCIEGQPIPAEALALKNWVGRQVIANVIPGKKQIDPITNRPRCDPGTGVEYEARPQIELFSYREAEPGVVASGQVGNAPHGQPTRGRNAGQGVNPNAGGVPAGVPGGHGQPQYQDANQYARAGMSGSKLPNI